MLTEPTVRQKRFASEIVAGRSKRAAYELSHPEQKMSLRSLRSAATRASKSPLVQAEIQRLLRDPVVLDACPKAGDPRALREHAIACMIRLTRHTDGVIAAHAARWLIDFASSLERAPVSSPKTERTQIIAELRGLYERALGPAPPLVETAGENEPEPAPDSFASAR